MRKNYSKSIRIQVESFICLTAFFRIPAAYCGLFGFKPSRGGNPTGPHHGQVWQGAEQEHVITRSVRDSAAALDATQGLACGVQFVAPFGREDLLFRLACQLETARPWGGRKPQIQAG